MDKYIGKMLDNRYEILEVIGVGGMAVVYKAMCHRLNRFVAIKILKDEYSNDAEFRRRFQGESQAVAMMSHPNIVNVYDVSKSDGIDYIVMELIDGITLKQYMERKGSLSWRETLHFAMQIAKALEHAHSRNIIHRDIKPHNIMILKDGSVKVADFGIARVATAQNTLTKEALGSVHYISPEQARGSRVDNRTDIYSLGVVMYQMLTGRPPYDGDSPVSVAIQHINGTPLLPSLLNSNIPTGLEQITMHAMCADLSKRYSSATDMLHDMEEFRKNPSTVFSFAADGSTAASMTASAKTVSQPQQQTAEQRARSRSRQEEYDREEKELRRRQLLSALLIGLGVLVLVGLVVLVLMLSRGNTDETEPSDTESTTQAVQENRVPNLIGLVWDDVHTEDYPYLNFVIDQNSYVYNSAFPEGTVCEQSEPGNTIVPEGTSIYLHISLGEQTEQMPELTGRSMDYAQASLQKMGLDLTCIVEEVNDDTVQEGYIVRTDPVGGATLKKNEIITLYVSKGPEIKRVKVPAVTGTALSNAQTALSAKNLSYSVSEEYSATVAAGYVISQYPAANTEVDEGTTITLVVSKGKQTVTMPNVIGDDIGTASDNLTRLGLVVDVSRIYSDAVPEDHVINQSYAADTELMPGTTVVLTVSLGPEPTEPTEPPTSETETSETTAPTDESSEDVGGGE